MTTLPLIKFPETPWFEETKNIFNVVEMAHNTWLFLYKGTQKCVVATLKSDKVIIRGTVSSDDLYDGLVDHVLALRDEQIEGRNIFNDNVEKNKAIAIDKYIKFIRASDPIEYENIHKRLNTLDIIFIESNINPRYYLDDLKEILKRYEDN